MVDSSSVDGTADLAMAAARGARVRLATDPALPSGWVGKVWALHYGLSLPRGEWVLGVGRRHRA